MRRGDGAAPQESKGLGLSRHCALWGPEPPTTSAELLRRPLRRCAAIPKLRREEKQKKKTKKKKNTTPSFRYKPYTLLNFLGASREARLESTSRQYACRQGRPAAHRSPYFAARRVFRPSRRRSSEGPGPPGPNGSYPVPDDQGRPFTAHRSRRVGRARLDFRYRETRVRRASCCAEHNHSAGQPARWRSRPTITRSRAGRAMRRADSAIRSREQDDKLVQNRCAHYRSPQPSDCSAAINYLPAVLSSRCVRLDRDQDTERYFGSLVHDKPGRAPARALKPSRL